MITPASRVLVWIPAVLSALAAVVLFSGWNRPLFYDEFVYFMATAAPSFGDALSVVRETTTNVNQGVTGAYLLVDWVFVHLFGAHMWVLRLPSVIAGVLLLGFGAIFLRLKGAGPIALTLFPLFMLSQELVMHYAGEARTYMPLAVSAVGLVTYYSLEPMQRSSWWGRTIGWSAALIGVLFHPYVALYWPMALIFGLVTNARAWFDLPADHRRTPLKILNFANPVLVLVGTLLYVAIAGSTWARGRATAFVNPFNFLPGPLPVEIAIQNLYVFRNPIVLGVVGSLLAAIALVWVYLARTSDAPGKAGGLHNLWVVWRGPLLLAGLAYAAALLISLSSILADFWIFPRQWIASVALVALAGFWGVWATIQSIGTDSRTWGAVASALATAAVLTLAVVGSAQQLAQVSESWARSLYVTPTREDLVTVLDAGRVLSDPDWMEFAQANADQGGSIWPEMWIYYRDTDWDAFVLRD